MVNRNSKAGHIPERSCVVCRNKMNKAELVRFVLLDNEIIFDLGKKVASRGYYVCDVNSCIEKLNKWKKKRSVKKLKKK